MESLTTATGMIGRSSTSCQGQISKTWGRHLCSLAIVKPTRVACTPLNKELYNRRDALMMISLSTAIQAAIPVEDVAAAVAGDSTAAVAGDSTAAVAGDSTAPVVDQGPSPPAAVKPKLYIARDFLFEYPSGWTVLEDSETGDSLTDRRRQNVVRAEVVSPDNKVTISVIQQQASKLKQSLLQITSITQLGSLQDVSRLILPPGTKIINASVKEFPLTPKDTGTVVGVIQRDPLILYRYSAELSNGKRSEIAAGVILGRVLLMGAGCATEDWGVEGAIIESIADSFKLLPK